MNKMKIAAAVLTGGLGITPVYYDHFRIESGLTLEVVEDISIISEENAIEGVLVTYHEEPIDSLRKVTYRYYNSGGADILAEDFDIPLTLPLENAKLLSADIESIYPSYIKSEINIEHETESNNIVLRTGDLKPGENIVFSIFLDDALSPSGNAFARVKNIRELSIKEYMAVESKDVKNGSFLDENTWLIFLLWPMLLFSVLCVRWATKVEVGRRGLVNMGTDYFDYDLIELTDFIDREMRSVWDEDELAEVSSLLCVAEEDGNEGCRKNLVNGIRSTIEDDSSMYGGIIFLCVIIAVSFPLGLYYFN
jgi:hypothetical protein